MKRITDFSIIVLTAALLGANGVSAVTFTNIYTFTGDAFGAGSNPVATNSDGINPNGFLLSGNVIYGTAAAGGPNGDGTLFRLNTDGTGFAVLHPFQYADGGQPAALALSGGTLYGVTTVGIQGISLGDGGVFTLIVQPTLSIALNNKNVILTWNDPSSSLYSALTPTNVFTKIGGATSPNTNAITGTQKYFGLR